jgi:hypothetical protein
MRFTTGHELECVPRSYSKNGASVTTPFLCGAPCSRASLDSNLMITNLDCVDGILCVIGCL